MAFDPRFMPLNAPITNWIVTASFPWGETFANTISPVAFSLKAQFTSVSDLVLPDGFTATVFNTADNTQTDFAVVGAGTNVYLTGRVADIGGGDYAITGNIMDSGTGEIFALFGDSLGNFTATGTTLIVTHDFWLSSCGDDIVNGETCSLMYDDDAVTVSAYLISPARVQFYNAFEIPSAEFADFEGGIFGDGGGFNMLTHDGNLTHVWFGLYQGNAAAISFTEETYLGPTFTYATELLDFEELGIVQAIPIGVSSEFAYFWKADTRHLIKVRAFTSPILPYYEACILPSDVTDVIGAFVDPNTLATYIVYSSDAGASYSVGLISEAPASASIVVPGYANIKLPCIVNCVPLIDRRK